MVTNQSTIAAMGEKMASVVTGSKKGLVTGPNFTAQYLYHELMEDRGEVSKMEMVRAMVKALDVQSFKTILADFVKLAGEKGDAAKKTAQNHQTVLRLSYGAIRFAGEALSAAGYTDNTGYQVMRVMAKKALDDSGLKWDGTPKQTEAQKQDRDEAKLEAKVVAKYPRSPGESREDWLTRIDEKIEEEREAVHYDMVLKAAKEARAKYGALLDEVIAVLQSGEDQKLDEQAAIEAAEAATKH